MRKSVERIETNKVAERVMKLAEHQANANNIHQKLAEGNLL